MVRNVIRDVKFRPRTLGYKNRDQETSFFTPWIMAYESGFEETKEKAAEVNNIISSSRTWSTTDTQDVPRLLIVNR